MKFFGGLKSTVDRQEFRRKLLEGLQFYCETPSLILKAELPADLVELISSEGYPVDALGVIIEFKKQAAIAGSEGSKGRKGQGHQRLLDISRKLLEHWITSDYSAQALASLSLGEESAGLLTETATFHRLVFSIPTHFHLSSSEFLKFLLNGALTTLRVLVHGIQVEGYTGTVRSQPVASFLERICVRFHSDGEHFYESGSRSGSNPFVNFVLKAKELIKESFVGRRLFSKVLLGLGSHAGGQLAKTMFLVGHRESCPTGILLHSVEDFIEKSPSWKNILLYNIPVKVHTQSKLFWTNWAFFIISSCPKSFLEVWTNCIGNWASLCTSSAVQVQLLLPATFALVALGREIKSRELHRSSPQVISEGMKVFQTVTQCLDSTSDEKKGCGMALSQIVADLHFIPKLEAVGDETDVEQRKTEGKGTEEEKKAEKGLTFETRNRIFHELLEFFEKGYTPSEALVSAATIDERLARVEILDSDDDVEDEDEDEDGVLPKDAEGDWVYEGEPGEFDHLAQGDKEEEEHPLDERLASYRSKKGKLPMYFSDMMEVLLESGGPNANEGDVEAVKFLVIMRIPLLLSLGVRIDPSVAKLLVKCLIEMEKPALEIPILFALLELCRIHCFEVFDLLATSAFDGDHYTVGHRLVILNQYSQLVQILSKEKCHNCYKFILLKKEKELRRLCPEFFSKYFEVNAKSRACKVCWRNPEVQLDLTKEIPPSQEGSESLEALTWKEIVDRRVAAKTRYFATSGGGKKKNPITVSDEYSSKTVAIAWSSLANRLVNKRDFFMNAKERKSRGAPNDMLLAQAFRVLGRTVLGTCGLSCPHLRVIADQVGVLVEMFISHEDAHVRRSVLALLAILISSSSGVSYIIEAVSPKENVLKFLQRLRSREKDPETQELLDSLLLFLVQATAIDYRLNLTVDQIPSSQPNLRVLPEFL